MLSFTWKLSGKHVYVDTTTDYFIKYCHEYLIENKPIPLRLFSNKLFLIQYIVPSFCLVKRKNKYKQKMSAFYNNHVVLSSVFIEINLYRCLINNSNILKSMISEIHWAIKAWLNCLNVRIKRLSFRVRFKYQVLKNNAL